MSDAEVGVKVREALADVLPALGMDGVGVEVVGVDGGVVQVRLNGTCAGCPSSVRAVVMGLEEELTRRVPG
ncbi:MAG: NifU family protein, partial [Gemmataceae bacterium]